MDCYGRKRKIVLPTPAQSRLLALPPWHGDSSVPKSHKSA